MSRSTRHSKSDLQNVGVSQSQLGAQPLPHNPQQRDSKQGQTVHLQNINIGSSIKGLTVLDEFMYGFPSDGLSVVLNKWWGSNNPEGSDLLGGVELDMRGGAKSKIMVDEDSSTGEVTARIYDEDKHKTDMSPDPRGTRLLTSIRKRAVDEGREARKLGVYRAHHIEVIGKKEKALLLGIFRSSLPKEWLETKI